MPELPEVQTISEDLNRRVSGRTIVDYWTDWQRSIKSSNLSQFKKRLIGSKIEKVERVGKNVVFHLSGDKVMLVHQKMTGHLMVGQWTIKKSRGKEVAVSAEKGPLEERVNQFIHAIFYLDNGKMIGLSDMRKFAKIVLGTREEIFNLPEIKRLGPDALDENLTLEEFKKLVRRRKKDIKLTLMDPSVIAGIGNIYADEILWSAKVHPKKKADKLSDEEVRDIFNWTKKILKKALKLRGSSVGDYRDASGKRGSYGDRMLAYRRTGQECKRCGAPIERVKTGQRSAHYCPNCQKL